MPINFTTAREITNAIEDAAEIAIHGVKTDTRWAWEVNRPLPHAHTHSPNVAEQIEEHCTVYNSSNRLKEDIRSLASVLEGLVWLAAWQHDLGIRLLERGLADIRTFPSEVNELEPEAADARRSLLNEDLPALRAYRKVSRGIIDRVVSGVLSSDDQADYIADYIKEILTIYHGVQSEAAQSLEI